MRIFNRISKFILLEAVTLLAATCCGHAANTFWTGPTLQFVHAAGGAPDKLTTNHVGGDSVNNVWLQRGATQPLYNAASETVWGASSPANTQWILASGSLANAASLTGWGTFGNIVGQPGNSPGKSVSKTFFVRIISDNIYLQLTLNAWGNNNGGTFTYTRTTPAVAPPTPTVSITNPVTGATFVAPASVTIGASAAVSSGSVTNVQFFTNGASLGSVTTSPFKLTANNLGAGSYVLTAVATAAGISATSSVVNISVLAPPTVSLTNPVSGATFATPASLKLGASASVSSGTVTNVQFFANTTTLLGSATAAPFTTVSPAEGVGSYSLTAVATAAGISVTSAPVNVTVVNPSPISMSAATFSGGNISFNFSANSGLAYVVQTSPDLMNWTSIATNPASSGSVPFSSPATNGNLFYRIGLQPNP